MLKYQLEFIGEEGIEGEYRGEIDHKRGVFAYKDEDGKDVIVPLSAIKRLTEIKDPKAVIRKPIPGFIRQI